MKRRIALSLALALSVALVSLTSSDSTAQAQQPRRFRVDTGLIIPGPHQKLRLTVNAGAGNDTVTVRFRRIEYMQDACSGGVCKYSVAANQTSGPMTLMPGEGAFFDIGPELSVVRGVVESSSRDVQINAVIMDAITGEIVTLLPTGTVTF